jgi:aromatic-amino-acid transaminase
MLADLKAMPEGSIVLLHACCHNPTGAELNADQWGQVIQVVRANNLIPFLDMAYQGFGDGIAEDGAVVRRFTETAGPLLISNSFSKSFSLYGERVGALSVVASTTEEAARLLSQLKRIVRTNYSNPPTHGGKVVATVLSTPELRQMWEDELAAMRVRIKQMRDELVKKLAEKAPGTDFSFVRQQVGMFSYSGLTKEQVEKLRGESIYAVDTGRICVAALNSKNIDTVVDAIAKVL